MPIGQKFYEAGWYTEAIEIFQTQEQVFGVLAESKYYIGLCHHRLLHRKEADGYLRSAAEFPTKL